MLPERFQPAATYWFELFDVLIERHNKGPTNLNTDEEACDGYDDNEDQTDESCPLSSCDASFEGLMQWGLLFC